MTAAHRAALVDALTDITKAAQAGADAARDKSAEVLMRAALTIRDTADAARTRLVEEGDEYVPVAWAIVDTCRISLAETRLRISHRRKGRRK